MSLDKTPDGVQGLIRTPKGVHVVHWVGNIAVGKSTIGRLIAEEFGDHGPMMFVEEPTGDWYFAGVDMLRLLYDRDYQTELEIDEQTISAMFQVMTFVTRLRAVEHSLADHDGSPLWVLFDRTVFCDKHVFSMNFRESGVIKLPIEAVLQAFWDFMLPRLGVVPEAVVYPWATPEVCHAREILRNRKQEAVGGGIPLKYFQGLDRRYNTWLLGCESMPEGVGFDGTGAYTVPFTVHNYDTGADETVHVPLVVLDCTKEGEPRSPREVYEIITAVAAIHEMARKLGSPSWEVRLDDMKQILELVTAVRNAVGECPECPGDAVGIDELYGELRELGFDGPSTLDLLSTMEEFRLLEFWADRFNLAPGARQRLVAILEQRIERQEGGR